MSRKGTIKLKNLSVIEDGEKNVKNHERRSNNIQSKYKVKQVDAKSFLNKLG